MTAKKGKSQKRRGGKSVRVRKQRCNHRNQRFSMYVSASFNGMVLNRREFDLPFGPVLQAFPFLSWRTVGAETSPVALSKPETRDFDSSSSPSSKSSSSPAALSALIGASNFTYCSSDSTIFRPCFLRRENGGCLCEFGFVGPTIVFQNHSGAICEQNAHRRSGNEGPTP